MDLNSSVHSPVVQFGCSKSVGEMSLVVILIEFHTNALKGRISFNNSI